MAREEGFVLGELRFFLPTAEMGERATQKKKRLTPQGGGGVIFYLPPFAGGR